MKAKQLLQQQRSVAPEASVGWTLIGMASVVTYAALATSDWRWLWLAALQEIELYKRLSGLALVLLIAAQWRLTTARIKGTSRRTDLASHRYWGTLAPLLVYLHADELGHAYVRVMCLAFLGLISLGLLHKPISRLRRSSLTTTWLITHVALATMLVFLIGYHAFNSFYFE